MDDQDYSLALEEARRGADSQGSQLTSLRSQTTGAVAVGGLCATFLGGLTRGESISLWTALAVTAFGVLVLLVVVISWPVKFNTSQNPAVIVGWVESGAQYTQQKRDLALHMGNHYDTNAGTIKRRQRLHCAALIALLLELAFLLIDLKGL